MVSVGTHNTKVEGMGRYFPYPDQNLNFSVLNLTFSKKLTSVKDLTLVIAAKPSKSAREPEFLSLSGFWQAF